MSKASEARAKKLTKLLNKLGDLANTRNTLQCRIMETVEGMTEDERRAWETETGRSSGCLTENILEVMSNQEA